MELRRLTLTLQGSPVDACTGDKNIVNNSEATLAVHPTAIDRQDTRIMKDCGFVEPYASAMDRPGEGNLVGMEEIETRLVLNLIRQEAKNIGYRIRGKENIGIWCQVCWGLSKV